MHGDASAHAGTGRAWPPGTRERGPPFRRAADTESGAVLAGVLVIVILSIATDMTLHTTGVFRSVSR
jgi:hypothetical protein